MEQIGNSGMVVGGERDSRSRHRRVGDAAELMGGGLERPERPGARSHRMIGGDPDDPEQTEESLLLGSGRFPLPRSGVGADPGIAGRVDIAQPRHDSVDTNHQRGIDGELRSGEDLEVVQTTIGADEQMTSQLGIRSGGVLDPGNHSVLGKLEQVVGGQTEPVDPWRILVRKHRQLRELAVDRTEMGPDLSRGRGGEEGRGDDGTGDVQVGEEAELGQHPGGRGVSDADHDGDLTGRRGEQFPYELDALVIGEEAELTGRAEPEDPVDTPVDQVPGVAVDRLAIHRPVRPQCGDGRDDDTRESCRHRTYYVMLSPFEAMLQARSPTVSTTMSRRTWLGTAALSTAALSTTALAGALTGCSTTPNDPGGQQRTNQSVPLPTYVRYEGVTPDLPGDEIMLDGFLTYPDSPVRYRDEPSGDGKPISVMTSIPGAIPPGMDQNRYWQAMNERIGSQLDITLSSNDDYTDKFATRMAGGELADIINVPPTTPRLPSLMAATCADLTEHLSGDAVKEYPALAALGPDLWRGCVFDGRILGIPVPRAMARTSGPLYRKDLLAEKGIVDPAPTDFEDLLTLCEELTDARNNRWCWDTLSVPMLATMLGLANNWAEEGGTFIRMQEQEGYTQALEAGRQMMEAGVVNPDGLATGGVARKAWLNGGTCLMTRDSFVAWNQFYTDNVATEGFEMSMMDLPGFDGGESVVFMGLQLNNITAFWADSDHDITTLLRVADHLAAPFGTEEYLFKKYGTAGRHYELDGSDPVLNQTGAVETGIGLQYVSDPPITLYLPGHPDVVEDQHAIGSAWLPRLVDDASYGLYSETQSSEGAQLDATLNDVQTQILLGREPVSAWTAALDEWRTRGGDKIRQEYQEALAATQ